MGTKPDEEGFTLLELLATVLLIGLLSAVLIPKITSAIARAKDAATLGNLAEMRAAISLYFADTDGHYPAFPLPLSQPAGYGKLLERALVPTYIRDIPSATPSGGHHRGSNLVGLFWNFTGNADDEGNGYGAGWEYDANPDDHGIYPDVPGFGSIRVLCKHRDSKGTAWSSY